MTSNLPDALPKLSLTDAQALAGPFANYVLTMVHTQTFRSPRVLNVLGSEAQYQAWCQSRPCLITQQRGRLRYEPVPRDEAAAHADSHNAFGISMAASIHRQWQKKGWPTVFHAYCRKRGIVKPDAAKLLTHRYRSGMGWARQVRDHQVNRWALERLAGAIGAENPGWCAPLEILAWADRHGLKAHFPKTADQPIIQGSETHQLVSSLQREGKSFDNISRLVTGGHHSYAVRHVMAGRWSRCENSACGRAFAPPVPFDKPYSRRFCSSECVTASGHREPYSGRSKAVSSLSNEAAKRFLYG